MGKNIRFDGKCFYVERHEKEIENLKRDIKELVKIVNQNSAKIDVLVYAVQSESDKTKM